MGGIIVIESCANLKGSAPHGPGGGLDFGNLFKGFGSSQGGGLQFKFHGEYCGLGHGDATYPLLKCF